MIRLISLNFRDSGPIYEQVKTGFQNLILSEVLKKDDKMPSVRELAVELAINPNTIQRAYRELEQEGYIYSVAGKGSFVSGGNNVKQRRIDECLQMLDNAVSELTALGISAEEIAERITKGGTEK